MLQFRTTKTALFNPQLINFAIMNTADVLLSGNLSLKSLSDIIDVNQANSKRLQVRLSWGFIKGSIYGRIYDADKLIYENHYTKGHTHICIAVMQVEFRDFLEALNKKRYFESKPDEIEQLTSKVRYERGRVDSAAHATLAVICYPPYPYRGVCFLRWRKECSLLLQISFPGCLKLIVMLFR